MKQFWELFKSSVIIQGSVTLLFAVTICIMLVIQRPIPAELWAAFGVVLGYWFGTKQNYGLTTNIEMLRDAMSNVHRDNK